MSDPTETSGDRGSRTMPDRKGQEMSPALPGRRRARRSSGAAASPGPVARWGGGLALALIALLTLGTTAALLAHADPGAGLGPGEWAALRFTVTQALLSAIMSSLLAVPVARALARRAFPGRRTFVALLGAPFLLPSLVAVFGLLAVWGRSGLLSGWLVALGLPPLDIYGLRGVVLAHVFFNLPLVARLLLQGWLAVPAETFRLAAQLGFGPWAFFRLVELPMLRRLLPGAFVLVFLLCMVSFAVAMTLGGGPRATTVELAIYQAVRFDFDLGRAALLALVQFALCGIVALAAFRGGAWAAVGGGGLGGLVRRWDAEARATRVRDAVLLTLLGLFLLLPLAMVVAAGSEALLTQGLPAATLPAAVRSIGVALGSTALALGLGLPLAMLIDGTRARGGGWALEAVGLMTIAASPFVIGTGLFILLAPIVDPFAVALPVTATVNAAMALPFVLRALAPPLAEARVRDGRLADSLGIRGFARFRLVTWARLRHPTSFAAGVAAALSMGDFGVIALFAPPDMATLPLLMQRLMGAYRMQAAAAVGLLLVLLTFGLFALFDRPGHRR